MTHVVVNYFADMWASYHSQVYACALLFVALVFVNLFCFGVAVSADEEAEEDTHE